MLKCQQLLAFKHNKFWHFNIYEQEKFHAQLSMNFCCNVRARFHDFLFASLKDKNPSKRWSTLLIKEGFCSDTPADDAKMKMAELLPLKV